MASSFLIDMRISPEFRCGTNDDVFFACVDFIDLSGKGFISIWEAPFEHLRDLVVKVPVSDAKIHGSYACSRQREGDQGRLADLTVSELCDKSTIDFVGADQFPEHDPLRHCA